MTSVTHVKPIDTTGIKDYGCRAVIMLGNSLGWNVVLSPGNPCSLIARDGTKLRVPTNTTVNSKVFQGYVSSLMTHSTEFTPTVELIDGIIACHKKMSDDHKRRLRLAVGETPQQHRERMAAMHAEAADLPQEGGLTQHIEIPETWEQVVNEPLQPPAQNTVQAVRARVQQRIVPPILSVPHIVRSAPYVRKGRSKNEAESDRIIQQDWSDGTTTYKCTLCSFTDARLAAFSGHGKAHMHERPSTESLKAPLKIAALQVEEPAPVEVIHEIEEVEAVADPTVGSDYVLAQIRMLLSIGDPEELALLRQENEELIKENQRLEAENRRLAADWQALQELIGKGRDG